MASFFFFNTSQNLFTFQNNTSFLSFNTTGGVNTSAGATIGTSTDEAGIVLEDQTCDTGFYVIGFDSDGNILCQEGSRLQISYCVYNSDNWNQCSLAPSSGNYCLFNDDTRTWSNCQTKSKYNSGEPNCTFDNTDETFNINCRYQE